MGVFQRKSDLNVHFLYTAGKAQGADSHRQTANRIKMPDMAKYSERGDASHIILHRCSGPQLDRNRRASTEYPPKFTASSA